MLRGRWARYCLWAAGILAAIYGGMGALTVSILIRRRLSHGEWESIPWWTGVVNFLLIATVIAFVWGLVTGRKAAWIGTFLVTAGIAAFYLENCLRFGWFTVWVMPIPIMLALLLITGPAVLWGDLGKPGPKE